MNLLFFLLLASPLRCTKSSHTAQQTLRVAVTNNAAVVPIDSVSTYFDSPLILSHAHSQPILSLHLFCLVRYFALHHFLFSIDFASRAISLSISFDSPQLILPSAQFRSPPNVSLR